MVDAVTAAWASAQEAAKQTAQEEEENANPIKYEIFATSESGARAYNEDRFIVVEVPYILLFYILNESSPFI